MASEELKPYLSSWEDDDKWTALLSPIRSTTANAVGVRSKIEFWKKSIYSYCQFTGSTVFTCDDIVKAFTRKGRTPQCIPTVIEDMARSGELYNINDFLQMKPINKQAWSTWVWEISKTPVHWAWKKVKGAVFPAPTDNCKFIQKKLMEAKAQEILSQSDFRGNVIQLGDLVVKCNWSNSQLEDALLAIHWLVCQYKAAVDQYDFDNPHKVLIKIAKVDETQVFISEKDICKYNLLKSIKQIEDRIADYYKKVDQAREQAKLHLKKNSKSLAMCQLKKKKRYESIINQQANVLNNLHGLLDTLDQAEANQEIFETLKMANTAIKNMKMESNINEDSVQEVMDDVRDTMEEQADIDSILSKSVSSEDNEELEKELDGLLQDQAAEDELCRFVQFLKLPDVPEAPSVIERHVPEANAE